MSSPDDKESIMRTKSSFFALRCSCSVEAGGPRSPVDEDGAAASGDAYVPVDEDGAVDDAAIQPLAAEDIPADANPALFALADELTSADVDETMVILVNIE